MTSSIIALASCTLDDMVKLTDISSLAERIRDPNFDEATYEASIADRLKPNHGKILN